MHLTEGPGLAEAAAIRPTVAEGAWKTEAAALRPNDPGGLSRVERAAFAVRIARLGGNAALARRYEVMLAEALPTPELAGVAGGLLPSDPRLRVIVEHVDMLTKHASQANAGHIHRLHSAGVADADIVRLSELVAFCNYQLRAEFALALLESVE